MEVKINKDRVLAAAAKCSTAKDVLTELFPECFKKKDFREIKTYEDAVDAVGYEPDFTNVDTPDEVAYKKLKVIAKAMNQGWVPDWNNSNQYKWFPWFDLSSGFGFSSADSGYRRTDTDAGSRLCFESEEKAAYAGKQFIKLYEEFITIKK